MSILETFQNYAGLFATSRKLDRNPVHGNILNWHPLSNMR